MTTAQAGMNDFSFVLSRAPSKLLTPQEETQIATELLQRRRRVRLLVLWHDGAAIFEGVPPLPAPHVRPFEPGLVRRVAEAETFARRLLTGPALSDELRRILQAELDAVDALRATLFERNLRLVAWVTRGFRNRELETADLFQEGCIALMRSVDRFDPTRGARLSTYATHAIRLGMMRALADRGRAVRLPTHRFREAVETHKARAALLDRLEREPRLDELAAESGLSVETVEAIAPALRPMVRLDAGRSGSKRPFVELLTDDHRPSPYEHARTRESRQRTRQALARLPAREREILSLRYGLDDEMEHTFDDIGRTVGLSRERTRQLESAARERMRGLLEQAG